MYQIVWSDEALHDFEKLHARHQRVIRVNAENLRHESTTLATRHRKPLAEPLDELDESTWELRIGDFRLFYAVDEDSRIVTVLRVILKGRWTTLEALRRSGRS